MRPRGSGFSSGIAMDTPIIGRIRIVKLEYRIHKFFQFDFGITTHLANNFTNFILSQRRMVMNYLIRSEKFSLKIFDSYNTKH